MRTLMPSFITVPCLLLGACGANSTSIARENLNPLTASRYGDELADTMANLIINGDPVAEDETMKSIIQSEIARGKQIAEDARAIQNAGMMGALIPITTDTFGYGLFVENMLYLSSDFSVKPGAKLHVYLTTVVDPRDVEFPDATAIDLGVIQSTYGAQQYAVPTQSDPKLLRTLVLWDKTLKRIHGFAQLSKAF